MYRVAAFFEGWRGLGRFWACVGGFLLIGAAVLQALGPPLAPRPLIAAVPHAPIIPPPVAIHPVPPTSARADRPGRDVPGPVNDPDPALQEPYRNSPTESLPIVALDGRMAMRHYATGFDPSSTRPRVGIMIAGMGSSLGDSKKAASDLPAEISFAVSPYAANPEAVLSTLRLTGHEYLLSIPMEPLRFPLSDPGPQALLTTMSPEQNRPRLHWAMSRFQGYVGATAILGAARGERLTDMPEQIDPILLELNKRGLLYVGSPSPSPHVWNRAIDLVIDEPATAADIDARLTALETMARDRGVALGLAVAPRPVTVERIAAWTTGLANRGLALAPVSALMQPPARQQDPAR